MAKKLNYKATTPAGTRSYASLSGALAKSAELIPTGELLIVETPEGERRYIRETMGLLAIELIATRRAAERYNAKRMAGK